MNWPTVARCISLEPTSPASLNHCRSFSDLGTTPARLSDTAKCRHGCDTSFPRSTLKTRSDQLAGFAGITQRSVMKSFMGGLGSLG